MELSFLIILFIETVSVAYFSPFFDSVGYNPSLGEVMVGFLGLVEL